MQDPGQGVRLPGRAPFAVGVGFLVPLLAGALEFGTLVRPNDVSYLFAWLAVFAIGLGSALAFEARGHCREAAARLRLPNARLLPAVRFSGMVPALAGVVALASVAALVALQPMAWAIMTSGLVYWAFAGVHKEFSASSAMELLRLERALAAVPEPEDQTVRAVRSFARDLYGRRTTRP